MSDLVLSLTQITPPFAYTSHPSTVKVSLGWAPDEAHLFNHLEEDVPSAISRVAAINLFRRTYLGTGSLKSYI
jgi:hypothetical protein